MPLELEDVEVPARHVHRDVVDRNRADRAFEATDVRVAMEDDVGAVLRDRRCEAVAAEIRPDPLRFSVQRVGRRRVVEQHDPDGTVRDLLETGADGFDLGARLGVDLPQERLAEVGQLRAGEPTHEALRAYDANLLAADLHNYRVAVEHVDARKVQHAGNLVAAPGMQIVIAEDRVNRHARAASGVSKDLGVLRLAVGGQVTGEQHEIGLTLDRRKGLLEAAPRRLGRVHVSCRRDLDHVPMFHVRALRETGQTMSNRQDKEFEALLDAMKRAGGTLNEAGIPFVLGGGLAAWARGGPKTEHDVDFLLKPADAERAQQTLAEAGMRTERPPEGWLLKAYEDGVLIDLIFSPQGGPIDDVIFDRAEELEVHAMRMKVASLEDVLVQKLLALSEQEPDYSSVLELARSLREQVDWNDVRERTNESPFAKGYFTLLDELEIVPA